MADGSIVIDTKIDSATFGKGMNDLNKSAKTGMGKMASQVASKFGNMGAMAGVAIGATAAALLMKAGQYFGQSIELASNLAEVQNVVDTTFEGSAETVNKWAKDAKEAYGMSELKAKKFSSTMGAMLKSSGLSGDSVLKMSTNVTGLAADMASFYNLDHETAFEKIRSGIAGETEPLKQLGINMSVANLEAFALSKGITKAYKSMSQAEQTTLRYNYLMEVTADAQGDFARTSEGYANQQRILDTTLEEISATIGQVFLPLATQFVKGLNNIVNGTKEVVTWLAELFNPPNNELQQQIIDTQKVVDDFNGSVHQAGDTLQSSIESTKATKSLADSLLSSYDKILSKNVLTEEDTAQLRTIAGQIVQLYPAMGEYLDSTTGQFNTNTTAIRDNITAISDQQMAMAFYSASQDYQKALLNAAVAQEMATKAYDAAYQDWISKDTAARSATGMRDAIIASGNNVEGYAGQLIALDSMFKQFFSTSADGVLVLNETGKAAAANGEIVNLLEGYILGLDDAEKAASATTAQLGEVLKEATDTTVEAQEGMQAATEAAATYGSQLAYQTTPAIDGASDANKSLADSEQDVAYRAAAQASALETLRDRITDITSATLADIDANVSGFDKADKVRTQSAKKTLANLESQAKYLADYQANFEKAKEKGVSEDVLSQLADGSAESAKVLAGLATATETQVAEINAIQATLSEQKTTLADTMATEQIALDAAAQTAQGVLDAAGAAVVTTAETTTAAIVAAGEAGEAAADGVETASTEVATAAAAIETNRVLAKEAAEGIVTDVETALEDGASDMKTAGATAIDKVAAGMNGNKAATTAASSMANKALAAIRSYFNAFNTAGYNIISQMAAGVTSGQSILTTAIQQVVAQALANATSKPPSTSGTQTGNQRALSAVVGTLSLPATASAIQGASMSVINSPTTVTSTQNVTFAGDIQAPDAIARKIRGIQTYGLESSRA